jgi:hypothetical protein
MVIASDKGAFAERADALRTELQKDGLNVTGGRSGAEHDAHQSMIAANRDALCQLIANNRDGNSDLPVQIYPKVAAEMNYEELVNACKGAIIQISNDATQLAQKLAARNHGDRTNDPWALLQNTRKLTGDLVDMMNYAPDACPELVLYQRLADDAVRTLRQATIDLRDQFNPDTTKVSPTREEIDFTAILAEDAMRRLQSAGGPGEQNRELEDEVLRASELRRKLGIDPQTRERMEGDLKEIFEGLYVTTVKIANRRAA